MRTFRSETTSDNWKPLKRDEKWFLLYLKNAFCSILVTFGHVGKWFDKKAKVDFKIYDVTNWETNNCNTHIVQDLKKQRQ